MGLGLNPTNYTDFGIPTSDQKDFTYVSAGAADNDLPASITFSDAKTGKINGVLTISYFSGTNNIQTIKRTS